MGRYFGQFIIFVIHVGLSPYCNFLSPDYHSYFYFGLPQSGKRHRSIFQEEEKNQKVCSQRVITDWRNPKFLNKSFQVFDAASLTLDFEAYTIKQFTIVIYH